MTEARGRSALGLLVIDRGGGLDAPQCRRLGGDQLVAENEDVVLFSSSHHSASMGRRGVEEFRYPHSRKADSATEGEVASSETTPHIGERHALARAATTSARLIDDLLEKDDSPLSGCIPVGLPAQLRPLRLGNGGVSH
jgi:hypothetical protein